MSAGVGLRVVGRNGRRVWTRSDTLPVADAGCRVCWGYGLVGPARSEPCGCALRAIFRACWRRWQYETAAAPALAEYEARFWRLGAWCGPAPNSRRGAGSVTGADYAIDFFLVARRTLREDAAGWRLFRLRYLEGADWRLCAKRTGLSRGNVFHALYGMEARLGRALRETQPYPLYPFGEYFGQDYRTAGAGAAPRREPAVAMRMAA